ncbi:MAG TPA: hypothetical protein VFU21_03390 [Kofleriaceae bacterium]|nr:hypothetical protein [Kofleriaceae bacterium]
MTARAAVALLVVAVAGLARADPIEAEVRRAYRAWIPPVAERVTGLRLVAVELAVRDQLGGTFGGRQVTVAGQAPALAVYLTVAGAPADPRDPEIAGQDRFGLLLLYVLPRALDRVEVQHRGRPIGSAAVEPAGPRVPLASHRVIAHAPAEPAPIDGLRRHRVLIEARDWPRIATPRGLAIAYRVAGAERRAEPDRWIEVDERLHPVAEALAGRPPVVPVRRFVLEYWLIEGGRPPFPPVGLALPAAAEAALARAEPDADAAHYRPE